MKNNSKGFTLIELLAVIIILAIVALVTTPAILNVINESRENGAKDKAWGTMDACKMAYTQSQGEVGGADLQGLKEEGAQIKFDFSDGNGSPSTAQTNATLIKMSGERPSSGTVTIDLSTGAITCEGLTFASNGKFICSSEDGNEMTCDKN